MTSVIEFERVTKSFPASRGPRRRASKGTVAVEEASLAVAKGSIVGVIGYSGAGKSTLVRLINGLERPTEGTVRVLGTDVGGATPG